jgi:putative transposase
MASLRYELSEAQCRCLEPLLPGRLGTVGRPAEDNRRFVNGVLWVIRSGMRWADLPERYGKYKSVHKRFMRWAEAGVWDPLFEDLVADRKNPYLMLDSTIVRAHQQAATGRKKGRRQGSGAFPRWTEHQDSPARQRPGRACWLPIDQWTGW